MTVDEELLAGGNSNRVVRVGDTVRRQVPPNGSSVHRLLEHLEGVGFSGAPRFLGLDDQGREILSYLQGSAGLDPMPAPVRSLEALTASVKLVREYHDATASLDLVGLTWPGSGSAGLPMEVVCHGDLAPYNVIFRGAEPVGLIDFDTAFAGSRIEDLAGFAYRFAPLLAERNYVDSGWSGDVDRFARLRWIAEQYGPLDWELLPELVLAQLDSMITWIRVRAERNDPAVRVHLAEDHLGIYTSNVEWIKDNRASLIAALRG